MQTLVQAGTRSLVLQKALLVAVGFVIGLIATRSFGQGASCGCVALCERYRTPCQLS